MSYEDQLNATKRMEYGWLFLNPYSEVSTQNSVQLADPFENICEMRGQSLEGYDPLHQFSSSIRKISGIEAVYFSYQAIPGGKCIVHFYTIIDADDKELRKRVYAVEMELMRSFSKDIYCFDFHLVARRGRELSQLLKSPGCELLFSTKP